MRRFVWRKKIEKDLTNGLDPRELSLKAEKKRQKERMVRTDTVFFPFVTLVKVCSFNQSDGTMVLIIFFLGVSFQAEIDKVKKRREERAIEKAQHEEEMVSILREDSIV